MMARPMEHRVAICGARHPHVFPRLELLRRRDDVELVGLFEPEERVAATLGASYDVAVCSSLEELLERRPTLAIVEGLDHQNSSYVTALAGANVDLLIEKPGASTLEDMRVLVEAVRATAVHADIGYMLRHSPIMPRLEGALRDGLLGPITLARFHAAAPVGGAAEIWQSLPEDLGGVLYTDGCHMMDIVIGLLGPPERVHGTIKRLPPGPEVTAHMFKEDTLSGLGEVRVMRPGTLVHEDCGAAVLEYPDALATFDVTGWEAHGWVEEWRVELYGTRGTLHAGLMPPWSRLYLNEDVGLWSAGWHESRLPGSATGAELTLVPDVSYVSELDLLLERLARGQRSQAGLERGLQVVEVLDAIYRSSAGGGGQVAPDRSPSRP